MQACVHKGYTKQRHQYPGHNLFMQGNGPRCIAHTDAVCKPSTRHGERELRQTWGVDLDVHLDVHPAAGGGRLVPAPVLATAQRAVHARVVHVRHEVSALTPHRPRTEACVGIHVDAAGWAICRRPPTCERAGRGEQCSLSMYELYVSGDTTGHSSRVTTTSLTSMMDAVGMTSYALLIREWH